MSDEKSNESVLPPAAPVDVVRQKRIILKQTLPSERLSIERWSEAMRAYPVVFEANGGKPVTNDAAGNVIGMAGTTIVMSNAFLCDAKLLTRVKEDGQNDPAFVPSPELMAFNKAHEWDPPTAGDKLRPAFERMWFCEALLPRLKMRAYEVKEVLTVLAEACGAGKEYESRLLTLLDLIAFAGVIVKEGNIIKSVPSQKLSEKATSPSVFDAHTAGPHKPTPPAVEEGHDSYTLVLDPKTKRKVIIQAPHTITTKELERIRSWLGVQLIIEESEVISPT